MSSGASVYDELLKDELASEDDRKSSLEQRGLAVITTSGVLVTLLFGLAALSTKSESTFDLSGFAESALAVGLIFFVLAAIFGLRTNAPRDYEQASPSDIKLLLDEEPISDDDAARIDVAHVRVDELTAARARNGEKADLVLWAMRFEVLAVTAVAIAIWDVLSPF